VPVPVPPPPPPDLGTIPADANLKGTWSAVYAWPLIPIHSVLMPDGHVLTYGSNSAGQQTGFFIYDVWTPGQGAANGHMTLPNGTGVDTFCSAQLVLPQSGDAVIAGGDLWDGTKTLNHGNSNSVLFSRASNALSTAANMNRPRWYASMTMLPNGSIYVQGGRDGTDRPEVRNTDGTFRLLANVDTSVWDWYYPRNWVAPDGRVFGYDSFGHMYYIDPTGDGVGAEVARLPVENRGLDASAAMFQPGKILHFGGTSNGAIVIDLTSGSPLVSATQAMSTQRRYGTATLLPDGTVLATGGSSVQNQLVDVSLQAETWNPATGTWSIGASEALARLYHSTAILLPDATVLVGGGGAPGPLTNLNVETYYPAYLFTADGKLAPRPAITAAPDVVSVGQSFAVSVGNANAVSKIALIKTGSVTHGWNMDQRYVPLAFSPTASGFTVQMPANAPDTPPGYYLLFVLNELGVPSVGKVVRVM
jgi:hypothetical protein